MHLPEHEPLDPRRQADLDRRRLRRALWLAGGFVALLWWIKMAEVLLGSSWAGLSIQPREATGLLGVLTAPLLHGSLAHLLSNTLPLLVLGTLAFAVYPRAATRAVPAVWLLGGLGVWLFARDSFHLGASGVALACAGPGTAAQALQLGAGGRTGRAGAPARGRHAGAAAAGAGAGAVAPPGARSRRHRRGDSVPPSARPGRP